MLSEYCLANIYCAFELLFGVFGPGQFGAAQVGFGQFGPAQFGLAQVGSDQVGPAQGQPGEILSLQAISRLNSGFYIFASQDK